MSLIPFSTGSQTNMGFVEKVKALVFPDREPENLAFPHARFIQNGLIQIQTFVECTRSNNVNFYGITDEQVSCRVGIIQLPARARVQAVYAFKPCGQCKRLMYEQKSVQAIMCFVEQQMCCTCRTENDICNRRMSGEEFCAQALGLTQSRFDCSDRIFARGSDERLYLAPIQPCDNKIAVHWEGIKYQYADADLIADDEDLINAVSLYLTGERALRIDRDMELHRSIMRKPERFGDWGGTFWQQLADMQHRCREERRIRGMLSCQAIFDDTALNNMSGIIPVPEVDQTTCEFTSGTCGPNQYEKDGQCFDCVTPTVDLQVNTGSIQLGESVNVSWDSAVPDIDSSVVTLEYGVTIIPLTRNESSTLAFTPTEATSYTIRAVTVCGTVTKTVTVMVHSELPCPCPATPSCLMVDVGSIVDCVEGDPSEAPEWDGQLSKVSDCVWELPVGQASLNGKSVSAVVTLVSCEPYVYRLTIRYSDGAQAVILWQGEVADSPLGVYTRTGDYAVTGCEPTTLEVTACAECGEGPAITFDPPAGSTVVFPTSVFLHSPQSDALIYYTLDGSAPSDISTPYTGAITVSEGQTIKAIAYTADGCPGEVFEANYVSFGEGFLFQFICDGPNDFAGVFGEFAPNGDDDDYHWRVTIARDSDWTLNRVEIYETNSSGVWVTGQAWATANPVQPQELEGADFSIYPCVVLKDGVQQNSSYADDVNLPYGGGQTVQLDMYGQPFVPLVGYFRLIFKFTDSDGEHDVRLILSHECYGGIY